MSPWLWSHLSHQTQCMLGDEHVIFLDGIGLNWSNRWHDVAEKLEVTNSLSHMCYRDWSVLHSFPHILHNSLVTICPIFISEAALGSFYCVYNYSFWLPLLTAVIQRCELQSSLSRNPFFSVPCRFCLVSILPVEGVANCCSSVRYTTTQESSCCDILSSWTWWRKFFDILSV